MPIAIQRHCITENHARSSWNRLLMRCQSQVKSKSMRAISVDIAKENEAGALLEKRLSSACRNGVAAFIPSCLNARHQTQKPIIRKSAVTFNRLQRFLAGLQQTGLSEFHREHMDHSRHLALGRNHINGIENFWSQTKRHSQRYNRIPRKDISY